MVVWVTSVERLFSKRPILCQASSKLLTPHPPHRPASVYPPAFGARGGHTRRAERGWGVNILEDAIFFDTAFCTLWLHLLLFQRRHLYSALFSTLTLPESESLLLLFSPFCFSPLFLLLFLPLLLDLQDKIDNYF
jgi:hypothetical protein